MRLGPTAILTALWELAILVAQSGFRVRGPYLTWRRETAFGDDPARLPPRGERIHAVLIAWPWSPG